MTELDLEEWDLSSPSIKKFSSLSIFNWRALESQFRSLSYSFSIKIMILRDMVNTSSLLKATWKIDRYRQIKNATRCVVTCFDTFLNIMLP